MPITNLFKAPRGGDDRRSPPQASPHGRDEEAADRHPYESSAAPNTVKLNWGHYAQSRLQDFMQRA